MYLTALSMSRVRYTGLGPALRPSERSPVSDFCENALHWTHNAHIAETGSGFFFMVHNDIVYSAKIVTIVSDKQGKKLQLNIFGKYYKILKRSKISKLSK